MSSSAALAPSPPPSTTTNTVRICRKRSRGAALPRDPSAADGLAEPRLKHPRTHREAPAIANFNLPTPPFTRWPELCVDSIEASQRCDRALALAGHLHPANVSAFVRGEGNRIGVVLGLHGLSAGPWQYADLAQAYARLGLDVYTPRMVGHGLRQAGRPYLEPMPDIDDQQVYVQYAQKVFDIARRYAQSQDLPLLIAAHSAGAVLAATLVQEHPKDIAGQVYINPLQAPTAWSARLKFLVARLVHRISWGRRWLRRATHTTVPNESGEVWPGYPTLPLSKIFPMLDLARNVWRSFVTTSVPTMLFVSDFDQTCDPVPTLRSAKKFFKNIRIHRFLRSEGVRHAMVSAIENPRADIRKIIYDRSGDFLAAWATRAGRPSQRSFENTSRVAGRVLRQKFLSDADRRYVNRPHRMFTSGRSSPS